MKRGDMMDERLKELVIYLKEEKMNYFDEFYELTKKYVYYMAFSILKDYAISEDILQDTFISFLKHIKRINPEKNIINYLIKIAKNLSLNRLKKRKRETIMDLDHVEDAQKEISIEKTEIVDRMKNVLNDVEFQVVILHVINNLKHKEIAVILKKPLGTITWIYKTAIDKVRRTYEDE